MHNTSRVKVSFLIPNLAIGGAETQLIRLANGLDRRRFTSSIICLFQGEDLESTLAPDVELIKSSAHIARNRFVLKRGVFTTRILANLIRTLRRQQPDVVHAYLPVAYVLAGVAGWLIRVPVIIASRRGLTSFQTYGSARLLARLANHTIDIHICNSEAVRDWAVTREHLSAEKTRVIHNGIDLPPLDSPTQPHTEWMSSGGTTAAMVANLIPYKGHREVLLAVATVAQAHPSFRLVLIGDGREKQALIDLARKLGITGSVVFAGAVPNAAGLMPAFDFTLLGSSEEGFPNALMESMARAIPVISTAVGGVAELVTDGLNGRLVPYGDTSMMAAAINWMIEHPDERRRMGRNARARIESEFSTERMVDATQAVYEELLDRRLAG